eukprot:COSAG01_NODE_2936_length_6828_cov_20.818992_6_plen_41_part_00
MTGMDPCYVMLCFQLKKAALSINSRRLDVRTYSGPTRGHH